MILEPPLPEDDGIPSFRTLVEKELGNPGGAPFRLQGPNVFPEEVLARLLPQYERWEFLGAGGMGVVYKAWHRELQRWAAVKFLTPGLSCDPRAAARFQNEASVLAQLHHPNIVPVHDFGCEGEVAWLVMDFLEGPTLQEWTRARPRKTTEIARMVAKIARAVGVAHASGITHRDLKPGNILVRGDEPVLVDFGLAQNAAWQHDTRLTQAGEMAGTAAYLAPEQVQPSLGEPAPATDVHACGVMLFEMLSGRLPRTGLVSEIIARLHQDDRPPRLRSAVKQVRNELDAICWKAMQKAPEDRYANGTSMAEDLERFLDGRPVRAKNPDLLDLAYLYVRRNSTVVAAGLLALLAVSMAAWSTNRVIWSKKKARLLSQINRQLTEPQWTPERLASTEGLLAEMHRVDTVLERHLKEDVVTRTHGEVMELLDAPRLSEDETAQLLKLLSALGTMRHPDSAALLKLWRARETAWRTVAALQEPITQEGGEAVFLATGWEAKAGKLHSVPTQPDQTWSTLSGTAELNGSTEVEVEFDEKWREAGTLGVSLVIPALKETRFYVFDAAGFARHQPDFENPGKAPVMAILSEMTPLVYAVLPPQGRHGDRLAMRCRYENGDLTLAVNGTEPLRHTRVFELARPLKSARFNVLLGAGAALTRLELRQRPVTAGASPLTKADDLVSSGQVSEALAIYEKYLNRADVKAECRYKYAACLEATGKKEEAVAAWERAGKNGNEPWKSLALYQLWRSHLMAGHMAEANAWFDLLTAGHPPEVVRAGIPTGDRVLINQHYLPVTRSVNSLKVRPEDVGDLDRAVRVQQFLGADDRQIAVRTAMAFHFAGHDEQARQLFRQGVTPVLPSASLAESKIHAILLCLDQWAALGNADGDATLQATLASWMQALQGSTIPARAVPLLEAARRELRLGLPLKKTRRATLTELANDPRVMQRHRVEAWLILGLQEKTDSARQGAWVQAVRLLDSEKGRPDTTHQKLHVEFIARSLTRSWTAAKAAEWAAVVLGKARPLISKGQWAAPMMASLAGAPFAKTWNGFLHTERGGRFARDYLLRDGSARDLAHEGIRLVLITLFCEGTGWPPAHADVEKGAAGLVKAYCARELNELALMQLLTLWSGVKIPAAWEMLVADMDPALRGPLARLLARRYQQSGQEADFLSGEGKEKPAP